jgi:hypothetical protein
MTDDNNHGNQNQVATLRREMHVLIEGVHDHIRLVVESAASQSEGIIRKLDEMNAVNREDQKIFKSVLANHEGRIATLEERAK